MPATRIGIPVPAHADAPRASGRYAIKAPDAPVGSVLRVRTHDNSTRLVEVVIANHRRLFLGLDAEPVVFADWDYAPRASVEAFRFEQQVMSQADEVERRGAAVFASRIRADLVLWEAVVEELRDRGKPGKASQVLAYLTEELP